MKSADYAAFYWNNSQGSFSPRSKYSPLHSSQKDPQFVFFITGDTKFHTHTHNGQNYVYVYIFVLSLSIGDGSFTYEVDYGNKNFIRRIITNVNSSGVELCIIKI